MKKIVIFIGIFVIAMTSGTFVLNASSIKTSRVEIAKNSISEELLDAFMNKTYATEMIYQSDSSRYDAVCIKEELLNSNTDCLNPTEIFTPTPTVAGNLTSDVTQTRFSASQLSLDSNTRVKLIVSPKFTWSKNYQRYASYKIITSVGIQEGQKWINTGDSIEVDLTKNIPGNNEVFSIEISIGRKTEKVKLTPAFPKNIISAKQAFKNALEAYYSKNMNYPTSSFDFFVEFRDKKQWVVSYNDNDGVGGNGYLLVDAFTGEVNADVKEDE